MVLLARNDPKALAGNSSEQSVLPSSSQLWEEGEKQMGDSLGDRGKILLQGAGSFSQQHCPLARGRQEREGKMAAGQQDGSSSLSLARPGVYLSMLGVLSGAPP